jgi:hypothetical protein
MAKCVEITMQDDGSLTVVECPPKEAIEGGGESFQDIKTALLAAAKILTSEQIADPGAAQAEAQGDMDQGFKSVRGGGL